MKKTSKKLLFYLVATASIFALGVVSFGPRPAAASSSDDTRQKIEQAMFARREFFGADALFPHPTAEASENLARLAADLPDEPNVLENYAKTLEDLGRFDDAEKALAHLAEIDPNRTRELTAFYHRHARFADEARVLMRLLSSPASTNKEGILGEVLTLASIHDLKEYLGPEFYGRVMSENPGLFGVFQTFIDRLTGEKNYPAALDLVRKAKTRFPGRSAVLLDKEIGILLQTNRYAEAEAAYIAAFDPFWAEEEDDKFYSFLSEHDRLREYGAGLKTKFAHDPADFDTAVKLADLRKYDREEITPVIVKLRNAKAAWTTEELVTVARLLLRENEGEMASRFLYTVYARDDFKEKADLRARVLYQLFEMFSDAETQKLPVTNGDLRFYEEIARMDTDPGITTGILSLIFSDSNPESRLRDRETRGNAYFNRAAAYKIFLSYREEFPGSPELYQMYLDLIRLYTATREIEVAQKLLGEFAEHYRESADYPDAALKLADAFDAADDHERARAVSREILDHLGKQETPRPSDTAAGKESLGINIPPVRENNELPRDPFFHDYLGTRVAPVTYAGVLEGVVASLAREKKTADILELYSTEIAKYPQAEWLYEQRLSWLEKTNLTEDQLALYREALGRFQSTTWSDKLARWLIRQNRQTELAELSSDLVSKLSDTDLQNYLAGTIDPKMSASEFEKQMYFGLYTSAHVRFPHNVAFVKGLLRYYRDNKREAEWRKLAVEYYFTSTEIRQMFLDDLAARGDLRAHLATADVTDLGYRIFRADAAMRLSNFEQAVDTYRTLNTAYPNSPDIAARLIELSRSFGQKDPAALDEAARVAGSRADHTPSSAEYRTLSGELYAESGNYEKAREEWEKLAATASGSRETYLDIATVYWDYFQYDDALRTIGLIRKKYADDGLYAFEAGAVREALHDSPRALREYVKALGSRDDDTEKERAKNRLAVLSKRENIRPQIENAFLAETNNSKNSPYLTLGYAEFLVADDRQTEAVAVLDRAISNSRDFEFLNSALDFYGGNEIFSGEQRALARLAEVSENPRRIIKYRLRLARSFEETRDRDASKAVLSGLANKFPLNYGVITEVSDLYRHLGFEAESASILQNALAKSRGVYKTKLGVKLSERLVALDRLDEAAQILAGLHRENPADFDLFRELAGVYVRKNMPDALRAAFAGTVAAIGRSDIDRREADGKVAEMRTQMIDAFTKLKDYPSAIEQHIEIINREPENEESTENAIAYARRYGGGDTLLAYYRKTSAEAFKNYRWNVVLARISESGGDIDSAVRNYSAAIDNQPEMAELYDARADLWLKQSDFGHALKDMDTLLELSGDAPEYIKKKIAILKMAGRDAEAETEKAKLPPDVAPVRSADAFAAARDLKNSGRAEARRLYRAAFDSLLAEPLSGELKSVDLVEYVRSVREEEPLDKISPRLWELRQKLIDIASEAGSTRAGEARDRLIILDGAMTVSVGDLAGAVGTDEELSALHTDLENRIGSAPAQDRYRTLDEILDIGRRAHFGDLEETVLRKKIGQAATDLERQSQVRSLIDFYNERGAYEKALAVMGEFGSDDLPAVAEAARIVGDREKELDTLRAIYRNPKLVASQEQNILRYLNIIHKDNPGELASLARGPSPYQLQLINFLTGKGEFGLAQAAVDSAAAPEVWKRCRRAEIDLALRQGAADGECHFCQALRLAPIRDAIAQKDDVKEFPAGDDWFRLGREYGEWLYEFPRGPIESSHYLAAMIEDQPENSGQQTGLGAFYMNKKDFAAAIRHFRLAVELDPAGEAAAADLIAAYILAGKPAEAGEIWNGSFVGAGPPALLAFFEEMQKFGLSAEAAKKLNPAIVKYLEHANIEDSDEMQNLVRLLAVSIKDGEQRTAYFRTIVDRRPHDRSLAAALIDESLIENAYADIFYKRLIDENEALDYYEDYSYSSIARRTWARDDAESVYDQENEYKTEEPENARYTWQKKYLEALLTLRKDTEAADLVAAIEKELDGKFARPAWLRLAGLRLRARAGHPDMTAVERFTGITVSDSVSEIVPPDLERFNDVSKMLGDEGRKPEAAALSTSYFARVIALGRLDLANFDGLARALFAGGESENAMTVVRLMIKAADPATLETASAETAGLDIVKKYSPDAAKTGETEASQPDSQTAALDLAARLAADFGRADAAIDFRRQSADLDPAGEANLIELARLLALKGEKAEAAELLNRLIAERHTSRASRWRAKWELRKMGIEVEMGDAVYDPFSQYYRAMMAKEALPAGGTDLLIGALIAGGETDIEAKRALVRGYVLTDRPFAALKLAESDKSDKPDDLLSLLSTAAEKTGNFIKAIELEKLKIGGGNAERILELERRSAESSRRVTDLIVDTANTRKL